MGIGSFDRYYLNEQKTVFEVVPELDEQGNQVRGLPAWRNFYATTKTDEKTGKTVGGWAAMGLPAKVQAFVNGGSNFLHAVGLPIYFGGMVLAVMVACFAATTLDTATRLQRYVVQELGDAIHAPPLKNKYVATAVACATGLGLAVFAGHSQGLKPGSGGMVLWPMFGATNQVLAGLGFLVIAFFLIRRGKPIWFLVVPAVLMLVLPAWAMAWNMFHPTTGWLAKGSWLLLSFGAAMQALTLWLVVEAALAYRHAKTEGMLPPGEPNGHEPPDVGGGGF